MRSSLIGLILVAMVLAGCDAVSIVPRTEPTRTPLPTIRPSPVPSPTLAPTASPVPTATTVNPLEGLLKGFGGWGGTKTFRAKSTTTGGTGAPSEVLIEFAQPDRFHVTTGKTEVIIIAATYYVKTGTKWQKAAFQALDLNFVDRAKIEAELKAATEPKFIGPEVLDGTPTLVYQYTTTVTGNPPKVFTVKVWNAVQDGLPRKTERVTKTGEKTVTLFYDYNANIVINPPVP